MSPDSTGKWKNVLVAPETPAIEAVRLIDSSRLQIALVVDPGGVLLGTVTDGDVRRALIAGKSLASPVSEIMFRTPTTAPPEADREALLALMQAKVLRQIPIVDGCGRVMGLETMMDLLAKNELPNAVVLMAGGRGQRLKPLTDVCPKPLPLSFVGFEGYLAGMTLAEAVRLMADGPSRERLRTVFANMKSLDLGLGEKVDMRPGQSQGLRRTYLTVYDGGRFRSVDS